MSDKYLSLRESFGITKSEMDMLIKLIKLHEEGADPKRYPLDLFEAFQFYGFSEAQMKAQSLELKLVTTLTWMGACNLRRGRIRRIIYRLKVAANEHD